MASFRSFLFLIIICGCSSQKSVLEELGKDRLTQAVNCFVSHINEERSDTVFSVSGYQYKGKSYLYIKTSDSYSNSLVNEIQGWISPVSSYSYPISQLNGCIIRDGILICYYGLPQMDGLVKKEDVPSEFKKLYTDEPVFGTGGYVLERLYLVKGSKVILEFEGSPFDDKYIRKHKELCGFPIKLSKKERRSIKYSDRLERKEGNGSNR